MLDARRGLEAVNLRGTDPQKFFLKSFRQRRAAPLVMCKPLGQRRLQKFAAQLVAGQPHRLEHRPHFQGWKDTTRESFGPHLRRIVNDFGPRAPGRRGGQRTVQEPQGGFAMIPAGGAKLIEDARLVRPTGALITTVDAG